MATSILPSYTSLPADEPVESTSLGETARLILTPLASLRLTVVLLALGIFLVFAGTLAQTEKDIWEVMGLYFRTPVAWIDFSVFFPRSFFPAPDGGVALADKIKGSFPFPGGFAIGGAMFINLLAAHGLRFKVQSSGTRLMAGLATIAVGIILTILVVIGGPGKHGLEGQPIVSWSMMWSLTKVGLAALWVANAYALYRVGPNRRLEYWTLTATGVGLGVLLMWLLFKGESAMLGDSSMRILWQLIKGGLAGVVLLVGCIMVFRKRAGIVLLHAGIGLIMANELVVYSLHDEGQMRIKEGHATNYAEDIRKAELAVVDRSPNKDDVVAVPASFLTKGSTVTHEGLPFDLQVIAYQKNSNLRPIKAEDDNLATAGTGRQWIAEETDPVSGADSGGAVDQPSAYIEIKEKGTDKSLGTYLFSLMAGQQDLPERIKVGDKTYNVALRFKRVYKDYSVRLLDVRKDDYMGTDTPRNYSSDVRLIDTTRGVDREVKIWMNNPLRFAGETFYQSNYGRGADGVEETTLQVVVNDGWMIPYVACMIVGIGMMTQFLMTLWRFANRKLGSDVVSDEEEAGEAGRDPRRMSKRKKAVEIAPPVAKPSLIAVPLIVVLVFSVWLAGKARVPDAKTGTMDTYEFGKLPLMYQGRFKPFDTLARNSLRIISDKEELIISEEQNEERKNGDEETREPAVVWLLDVISGSDRAEQHQVFRIVHPEVRDTLELPRRKSMRYSVAEILPRIDEFNAQVDQARKVDPDARSVYQRKLLDLDGRIRVYTLLDASFKPLPVDYPTKEEFSKDPEATIAKLRKLRAVGPAVTNALMAQHPPLAIPPQEGADWEPFAVAWYKAYFDRIHTEPNPATVAMSTILDAWARGDAIAFNKNVTEYAANFAANPSPDLNLKKVHFEAFFNHFAPFYYAAAMYLAAFVLAAASWLGWTKHLSRAAFWLILLTFTVHTFALIARIYISGRPPVTNLYSSAVFIGWGCVLLGIILELVFRLGIGNLIAPVAGFMTLIIAHFLAADGDTFTVLQAVLDTQFWLATHVTCITLGYSTTFLAGLLGILYIALGFFTPRLTATVGKDLSRMIYGTLCFAMFFSFVGTVLGGLWADDSWGRFWGWDPKENGALMIVLWNALVLHARWGAMIKERGLAVLSLGGNIITSWSWFGVNELGVGLHSYGFTEGVLLAMSLFIGSQLLLMAIGSLPKRYWWSFRSPAVASG